VLPSHSVANDAASRPGLFLDLWIFQAVANVSASQPGLLPEFVMS